MTTELEKQFFDTFGIEERCILNCCKKCKKCGCYHYPRITDRHYLELILVYSEISNLPICYSTVEGFKEAILECFIEDSEDYNKHQVQAIFEGE